MTHRNFGLLTGPRMSGAHPSAVPHTGANTRANSNVLQFAGSPSHAPVKLAAASRGAALFIRLKQLAWDVLAVTVAVAFASAFVGSIIISLYFMFAMGD